MLSITEGNSHTTSGRRIGMRLVDLFAFTSVVSRMHRTGNERGKECLAMPRQSSVKATAIVAASFPPFFSFLVIGFIPLIVVGQG